MAALASAAAPYGMKAIRQIKGSNTTSKAYVPTVRQQKRKERTYVYFVEKVDPILGECITHLLLEQPADIITGMIAFLQKWDARHEMIKAEVLPSLKPKKEMKLYLATSIGPVVGKLANRVAAVMPPEVIPFMIQELERMKTEDALIPDKEIPAKKDVPSSSSVKASATTSSTTLPVSSATPAQPTETPQPRTIQIGVFGLNNTGKTTIMNILQGKFDAYTKPTIGFRPLSMALDEMTKVQFYDIGGGKKIRDIWDQYYHDIHAVLYVLDATSANDPALLQETVEVFKKTVASKYLQRKPLLIFANKQDLPQAQSAASWQEILPIPDEYQDNLYIAECSSLIPENVEEGSYQPDPNIEGSIEMLIQSIFKNYDTLNARVKLDCQEKAKEEAKKRIERERKVLRNKIASAFIDHLPKALVESLQVERDEKNIFDVDEGISFLASEIGEDAATFPEIGRKISAMIGYQRLALQIVGALKSPINKKKVPMSWEEIYALVEELRHELGLPKLF